MGEPVIIYKLFTSVHVLTKGMSILRERCVSGITANRERCHEMVHNSIGIVTALLPHIGYKKRTEAAAKALKEKRPVADIVVELGYLDRAKVEEYLQPESMCGPTAKKRKIGSNAHGVRKACQRWVCSSEGITYTGGPTLRMYAQEAR